MAFNPDSSGLMAQANGLYARGRDMMYGVIQRFRPAPDLNLEPPLFTMPGLDPLFFPRVPMESANLDVGLLTKLSNEGYKRGREMTAQTHPELHRVFVTLCQRAGLNRVPQLILTESRVPNAASLSGENAVVMTSGLLRKLTFREVSAVLGHEIGHESRDHTGPRVMAMTLLGGGGAIIGDELARRGGIGGITNYEKIKPGRFKSTLHFLFGSDKAPKSMIGYGIYIIAGGWLGLLAAKQLTIRPTELDADHQGALISGDPLALASALEKLEGGRDKRSLGYYYRKMSSGYPSTERRTQHLCEMATHMPAGLEPAVAIIPGVMEGPAHVGVAAVRPAPLMDAVPSSQIHAASASERVEAVAAAPTLA